MYADDVTEVLSLVGSIVVFVVIVYAAVVGGIGTYTTTQGCLASGYASSHYSMWGTSYCIKRVDQTDVVIPYADKDKK